MKKTVALAWLALSAAPSPLPQGSPASAPQGPELRIKLPYRAGNAHTCIQGNGGDQSHHPGGKNEFAVDFRMSPGTRVCAAAAGRVVALVQDIAEDAPWSDFGEFRNFIWIDHGVGLYTVYGNIREGSATVRLGQLVNGGQQIAKSGEAEMHQHPHLHFAVTDSARRTVPLRFVDKGIPKKDKGIPILGQLCESENDGTGMSWFMQDSMLAADTFGETIQITSPIPASSLRWNEKYTLRGRVVGEATRRVALFFTRPPGTHAVAHRMFPVKSGLGFELSFTLAEFGALTEQGYRFSLAPVAKDQSFANDLTIDFVILDREPFTGLPMNLPFKSGKTYDFRRLTTPSGDGTGSVVLFELPKGTEVLAAAHGRVVAIGKDMELPFDALARGRKTNYITLDHGYDAHTTYFGLAAKSVKVELGAVVNQGARIAESHKSDLDHALHVGFAVSDHRYQTSEASFLEWEEDPGDQGQARSANEGSGTHVFLQESVLGPDDFGENEVTLTSQPPAWIYHAGETYVIEGRTNAKTDQVAFLVRARGKDRVAGRIVAPVAENGSFRLTLQLSEIKLPKAGTPLDYAITAHHGPPESEADRWRPLALMR